jgi:hypothetical protein
MPHTVEPGQSRRNLTTVDGSGRERVKAYCAVSLANSSRRACQGNRSRLAGPKLGVGSG